MDWLSGSNLPELIARARREDLGGGDVTAALLANRREPDTVRLVAKQAGVFAGREIVPAVLAAYDESIETEWNGATVDGAWIDAPPAELARIRGPLGSILSAERVLLNFLQRLCGVATATRQFVEAVKHTDAAIYDTRKTVPGWRALDKYAVRCGGGRNHRDGLYDAVLIKDNHLAGVPVERLAAVVFDMLNRLDRQAQRLKFVEVEVQSLDGVRELLKVVGVDAVLLDNFAVDQLREAVRIRDALGLRGKVELEASGGITLSTVRHVAQTGVERISIGAITHSAPALDLSLERL